MRGKEHTNPEDFLRPYTVYIYSGGDDSKGRHMPDASPGRVNEQVFIRMRETDSQTNPLRPIRRTQKPSFSSSERGGTCPM